MIIPSELTLNLFQRNFTKLPLPSLRITPVCERWLRMLRLVYLRIAALSLGIYAISRICSGTSTLISRFSIPTTVLGLVFSTLALGAGAVVATAGASWTTSGLVSSTFVSTLDSSTLVSSTLGWASSFLVARAAFLAAYLLIGAVPSSFNFTIVRTILILTILVGLAAALPTLIWQT